MSMMTKSSPADARISIVSSVGNFTNMPINGSLGRTGALRSDCPSGPQIPAGQRGAFDQRRQLCPLHLRMDADHLPALRKTAIGAGDDVLFANHTRIVLDPPGDKLRMLDDVGRMTDDARNQNLACGQFDVLPDHP